MSDRSAPGEAVDGPLHTVLGERVAAPALSIPWVSESWNFYLLSFGAMLALAGLDFIGSVLAKEWTLRHHTALFVGGMATFSLLFCVLALSLRIAELTIVSFGWIVFVQVAIMVIDRYRYGVTLSSGKWVAVALILALQAYLVLAPNGEAREAPTELPAPVPALD